MIAILKEKQTDLLFVLHFIAMFFNFLIISILLFTQTYEKESDCGCSANNERRKYLMDNNLLEKNLNLEQCSSNKFTYSENAPIENMVLIPDGEYQVGTDDIAIETDKEGPKRMVKLKKFYLDKYEVSNSDFNHFATVTNYKTEAETFGDSFVFTLFLNNTFKEQLQDFRVVQAPWWYKVVGANWRHPHGPDSDISGIFYALSIFKAQKYCTLLSRIKFYYLQVQSLQFKP